MALLRRCLISVGLVLLVAASTGFAQERKNYVPADTLAHVHYSGLARAATDFKGTAIADIIAESEVQIFGKEWVRFVDLMMGQFLPDPAIARWKDVRMLLDCEVDFALLDTGEAVPEEVIIIHPHEKPEALKDLVDRVLAVMVGPGGELPKVKGEGIEFTVFGKHRIGWIGNDLVICGGMQSVLRVTSVWRGRAPALKDDKLYQSLRKKLPTKGELLCGYVDVMKINALGRRLGETVMPDVVPGADAFSKICFNVAPDAPGVKMTCYLHVPGGAKGFWRVLPMKPLDEKKLLSGVSDKTSAIMATTFDIKGTVEFVNTILKSQGERPLNEIVTEKLGFDVVGELSASLADEVTIQTVGPGFLTMPEFFISIGVKDPVACKATLDKLVRALAKLTGPTAPFGPEGFGSGRSVMMDQVPYKGRVINAVKITATPLPVTPSFALSGNRLIVAAVPQTVKKAIDCQNAPGASILNKADFIACRRHVSPKASMITYADTRKGFAGLYGGLLTFLAQMSHGIPQAPPHNLATRLPSSNAIVPHLIGSVGAVSFDGEGFLFESYGTLGGIMAGGEGQQMGSVGQMGILAGFMLPALTKAQGSARRAASMSNVRQIGLAMIQYAADHDDKYPDSFGVLLKEGYLVTPKVFLCPSGRNVAMRGRQMPTGNYAQMPLAELKKIDELSDYVRVKGITHADGAELIIVHGKDGAHRGRGRNCLRNDCSVRWLPEHEFQRVIKAQQKRLLKKKNAD